MNSESWRRWRLVLGAEADTENNSNGQGLNDSDVKRDITLEYLYQHEYQQRGAYPARTGGSEASRLTPANWLATVRTVFPKSTIDVLQKQAIERYHLTELLTDPDVLRASTPNMALVQTLLSFKHHLQPEVMSEVRRIIRTVCDDMERVLAQKVLSRFSYRRLRHKHGGRKQLSNLDWSTSIRRNLKNYNEDIDHIILERLYFYSRQQDQIPWEIFLVVDQSGSMLPSIIHASVLAAIFCQVRALKTHLILFDTQVVDLTECAGDPVENLLAVQLGGGTDIGAALAYTAEKIAHPQRSMVVLISDFYEGGDESLLLQQVQHLHESRVSLLGLAALDVDGGADYDERMARQLVDLGMSVAALTPDKLASWVADTMGG